MTRKLAPVLLFGVYALIVVLAIALIGEHDVKPESGYQPLHDPW